MRFAVSFRPRNFEASQPFYAALRLRVRGPDLGAFR
jgi:hypothetical protein